MVMKTSSLLYSNRSSREKLWLDPVRYYVFSGAKSVNSVFLLEISEAKTHVKAQISCPMQAEQVWKVLGRLNKLRLAALAHMWCDCESHLWHKHHKVNLWMTLSNKWPFFQGYPACYCSTYVSWSLEVPWQITKKNHSGRWCLEDVSNSRTCGYVIVQARWLGSLE